MIEGGGNTMEYSAGMVSKLFWLLETRKTAELLIQEKSINEIKLLAINENIYQVQSDDRASRIAGVTIKRLQGLSHDLVEQIVNGDVATAKLIILISIMKTDRLFFQFMHEVYRTAIIVGDQAITDQALNTFFEEKITQSERVAKWSESTIKRLKQCYIGILYEAGVVMKNEKHRNIMPPHINYKLKKQLEDDGLTPYLNAVTGEA